jgi:hypothetical protein
VVSQIEPAGQQALQFGPVQGVVPAGQASTKLQVATSVNLAPGAHEQIDASLEGQQDPSGFPHPAFTQVHPPPAHLPLTWQRVPQVPQLRGSVLVSTQTPSQQLPPAHAAPSGFVFLHLPCRLRFLQGGQAFLFLASVVPNPSVAKPPPKMAVRAVRREPALVRERARVSKRMPSIVWSPEVACVPW